MKRKLKLSRKIIVATIVISIVVTFSNTSYTNPPSKKVECYRVYSIDKPQGILVTSSVRG